ncbi:ComF family protein [Gilvimarinus sp. F26214L]|uniref:ComF family protein n=1 Tax=Gilvimarinus sp. DZF01 TaxID=3461371 RepID=UPI0040463626
MVNSMDLLEAATRVLLPSRCLLCGGSAARLSLCDACREELPWLEHSCGRCAIPLPGPSRICGSCLRSPPAFDRCRAAFRYGPPIDRLVGQLKNQRRLGSGALLTRLLLERLSDPGDFDLVAPVPLHWRRQLLRGFNQAAFIAEYLSRSMQLPLVSVAVRERATPKQQQLNRRKRLRNLDGVFRIDPERVEGRRLLLVDDVVTTGATAEALSRQLREAGAKWVEIWALARTPAPDSGLD